MSTDLSSQIAELVRNEIQRQVAVVVNPPPVPVQNNIQSAIPSAAVPSVQNIRSQDGAGITTAVSPLRPALINHFNTAVPQLNIRQLAPQLNIFQPAPQLNIRQPAPQLNIRQPAPQLNILQPAPQLNILQPALQSSQGMNFSTLQHNSSQFNVSHQVLAGDMLPTIPPAQVRKIINREYIDFNALLPDSSSVTPGSYSIEMDPSSQDTTLSLIPRPSQHKIKDFFSWLLAWNNFLRAYSFYHAEMTPQLMFYQSMICQYAQQYVFEDVQTFDRNFRIRIANGRGTVRWDRHDPELVARFLRMFKLVCYHCKQFGHYASACSSKPTPTQSRQFHYSASSSEQQPFLAPQ